MYIETSDFHFQLALIVESVFNVQHIRACSQYKN